MIRSAPARATTLRGPAGSLTAMELIAAVLIAGPLGYFIRDPKRARTVYLALWALIFPIQTIVVINTTDSTTGDYWQYPLVNAAILALGIGANHLGARLRARRRLGRAAT
jgi:hypothetical protein